MTAADDEANRRHLAALIGGPDTRWRDHIQKGTQVLGVQWNKLPVEFRRKWWKATDYDGRHPRHLRGESKLLAAEYAELEAEKHKIAADTAAAREVSRQAEARRPCEQCLLTPLCRIRCLRSMGAADRPEPETIRRKTPRRSGERSAMAAENSARAFP
jgi:hypothetical protein